MPGAVPGRRCFPIAFRSPTAAFRSPVTAFLSPMAAFLSPMTPRFDPKTGYRWLKVNHRDLECWQIAGPLPWPTEAERKVDPEGDFPFAKLLKGIVRLRAAAAEWDLRWVPVEEAIMQDAVLGAALERGDFPTALELLEELERIRPATAYGAWRKAFILEAMGCLPEALKAAAEATARAPGLEHLWMRCGALHEALGQGPEAIACYRTALALHAGHPPAQEALLRLGEA